jgi:hypothetical protein
VLEAGNGTKFQLLLPFYIVGPFLGLTRNLGACQRKSKSTTRWLSITLENTPTRCDTMWFLCAPTVQLVDQFCTTFSFAIGSNIHHQRPQPLGFSHIGWSKLLPTSYKARETSLVSYEHNRKTMRCLAHLCLLPRSTCLPGRWTRPGVSSCFCHLGWTKPRRNRKGYEVPN